MINYAKQYIGNDIKMVLTAYKSEMPNQRIFVRKFENDLDYQDDFKVTKKFYKLEKK